MGVSHTYKVFEWWVRDIIESEVVGHTYMKLALLVNIAKEDGPTGSSLVYKTQDSKGI